MPQNTRASAVMATDYLYNFDVNHRDRKELGMICYAVVNGQEAPEEIKDEVKKLIHHSLLRGLEAWEQMLCCAQSMKEHATFDNPLDGQDLLTFLTILLQPEVAGTVAANVDAGNKNAMMQTSSTSTKKDNEQRSAKRRKVEKQSPYWSESNVKAIEVPTNKKAEKLVRKRERRRAKKARRKLRLSNAARGASSLISDEASNEAPTGTLDTQESMSETGGDGVLEDSEQQQQQQETSPSDGLKMLAKSPLAPSSPLPPPLPGSVDISLLDTATTRDDSTTNNRIISGSPHGYPPSSQTLKQPLPTPPKRIAKSHYFDSPSPSSNSPSKPKPLRPPRGTVSSIPFPPLDAPCFGLIQEELAGDPFRLLVAVTFLIRTAGRTAIPVFRQLMSRYPTPSDLAKSENTGDIVAAIRHLGLGAVRAAAIQKYARLWAENPPRPGVRYAVKNYDADGSISRSLNNNGSGGDNKDDDVRASTAESAWEIGHMTQGRYALDSWRIFCRDALLGRAVNWQGEATTAFQPEWMRVRPEDKELRAYLRWMWMREGWDWDPRTGDRKVLSEEIHRAVQERRVAWDEEGGLKILEYVREV
ncbi:hypothetical protein F4775DRAFT_594488 [Biscogniauxia sp. FL1348]|nr:hypothetical protein F4775DRAFT_594488 [Biscogniauxia sp. FL1348]